MIHHIYPRNQRANGVSNYGHQMDEVLKGAKLDRDVWHFELSYTGTDELWAADRFRRTHPGQPYVLTLHDPPMVCGKPFSRFVRSISLPAKALRKALDLTWGRVVIRRVVRGAAAVIVLNPLAKPAVMERFGLRDAQVTVLPLLPSLEAPASAPEPVKAPVRFLFFGILTPRKGVEDLIRAFAALPQSDSRLTVFGGARPDNPGYQGQLEQLAKTLSASSRVTFTGYGDDAAMGRALQDSDVVVLPYHDAEVIHASGPLITAMAYGRAVIASHIPIFSGTIEDGKTGLLFPSRDVEALASTMRKLAENPAEASRLGAAAAQHIHDQHSEAIIRQRLLEVYKAL